MTQPTQITDTAALARNRARAARQGFVDFLHREAATEVQERCAMVNKTFTSPALVTGHPAFWGTVLPDAQIVPDTEVLPLEPDAHDLVVHALALHWANDPVGQIIQCRRALRPDGMFIAVLFGGETLADLRTSLAAAEIALTGGLSPRILPMGDVRDLGALLQRAGLALPVADVERRKVQYDSPLHLLRDLRGMGEGNALAARHKRPAHRELFTEMAARYTAEHANADGKITATFDLAVLTGWAQSEDQPKPLRPGSAQVKLAEALGTEEVGLGDAAPQRN